jgi:hypothetical protein
VPSDLFSSPFKHLLVWGMDLLPDMSIVLVTSWFETLHADYLYFARPLNIILFVVLLCVTAAGAVYLYKLDAVSKKFEAWTNQAMVLGLPSLVLGILPFYIASYSIHLTEPPFNARFALGMLPGAALITAAAIETLLTKQNLKIMISVIVLGLAVSWHIRYTNDYRKVWDYQAGLLQQLTWRAPGLEKGTAVFIWQPAPPKIENSFAGIAIAGDFPLALAINSIYDPNPVPTNSRLSYWYYPLAGDVLDVSPAAPLHAEHDTTVFDGNTSDGLFFYYDPANNRCLHLIGAEDQYYQQYPAILRQIAIQANTDHVMPTLNQNAALRDEVLGTNEESWCFYYQKAELARQYHHWDSIPLLWQMAADKNLNTKFGTEYMPFIDGFAQLAEWQQAQKLTISARKLSKGMDSMLCPLWNEIERSTLPSAQRAKTINDIKDLLNCSIQ